MAESRNIAKGKLVRRALSVSRLAIESGFYLEAIALVDSVVSECINRIVFYSSDSSFRGKGINDSLRKMEMNQIPLLDSTLIADTLLWGRHRNRAIHGFIKLNEFDGADWDSRRALVGAQAQEGYKLARRWLREATKHRI